ncbi:hypothetical protein M408DRAFT_76130, partial [Serendipita vermifera MAFF 305830]
VQCVRRYADSGQHLHLVNGGKYGSSILYYALYYNWRNAGSPYDKNFIAWVIFACVMSCYTTSWDFLMDWSLFQRDSKYRFLRKELIYTNHIWVKSLTIDSSASSSHHDRYTTLLLLRTSSSVSAGSSTSPSLALTRTLEVEYLE